MTPLQRASVELQAACEHHTVADLEWLRGVLLRALTAERRRIRKAIRNAKPASIVEDAILVTDALAAVRAEGRRGR